MRGVVRVANSKGIFSFQRRLLSRKSKPSMEDLVDHHRPAYWIAPPSSSSSSAEHHDNVVNGNHVSDPIRIRIRLAKVSEESTVVSNRPVFKSIHPASTDDNFISQNGNQSPQDILGQINGKANEEQELRKEKEEEEDNLPLADLCKRTVLSPLAPSSLKSTITATIATSSSAFCAAPRCHSPAIRSDSRWDGQFCSVECLLQACHEAFCRTFRDKPKLRQREAKLPKHYLSSPFKNSTGIVS